MKIELLVGDRKKPIRYQPAVEEGIEWSTERAGTPGKLVFKVLKDATLDFTEGSAVTLKIDGEGVFSGFVFKQQRAKDQIITVTAYDQMRFLKNKDTFLYENKTASQFLAMAAKDYALELGAVEDTKFIIDYRVEKDVSLFEMIGNALDQTLFNTGELFVLYDDFGKLALKSLASMRVGSPGAYLMLDEETGESMDYTSSIDDNTYNKVVLKNSDTDKDFIIAHDMERIAEWGTLTYTDTYKQGEDAQAKAEELLKLYNKKTRNLKLSNVLGDNRVRAGSLVIVNLDLGDINVKNFLLVEKCKHTYKESEHWMDLTLRGGEFVA